MPERTFFQIIADNGFPNRFKRFCCGYLKEYKVLDKSIIGIRRVESRSRNARYTEPTECRYYKRNHKPENRVEAYYPILEWTDDDVYEFITKLDIQCHPLYYDENGEFQVKRRLGCMCCPLKYEKKRIQDFKEHPNMVKAYIRAGKRFLDTHPNATPLKRYGNVYKWLFRDIFFRAEKDFQEYDNNLFGGNDYKTLLEQNFNVKL